MTEYDDRDERKDEHTDEPRVDQAAEAEQTSEIEVADDPVVVESEVEDWQAPEAEPESVPTPATANEPAWAEDDVIEAEWTQADTPGSDVELMKLSDPSEEETTNIEDETAPTTELPADMDDAPTTVGAPRRIFRDPVADAADEARAEEAARLEEEAQALAAAEAAAMAAEQRRIGEERAARNRALGVVAPVGEQIQAPPPPQKLVTDKFVGAAGLFLFRLIIAAVLGVRGFQMITDIPRLEATLTTTLLPQPQIMAWVAAIATLAIALALALGAFVRVAGFGLLTMMVLALVFVRWGAFQLFLPDGFYGELELVLAGVGLVFLSLGGGRWGADGSFRASRAAAKAAAAD